MMRVSFRCLYDNPRAALAGVSLDERADTIALPYNAVPGNVNVRESLVHSQAVNSERPSKYYTINLSASKLENW
jgi:hypothetical protein